MMLKNIFFCLLSSGMYSCAMEENVFFHAKAESRTNIFKNERNPDSSSNKKGWLTPDHRYYIENHWSSLIIRKSDTVFTFSMPNIKTLHACAVNADGEKLAVIGGSYLYIWDMYQITNNMIYSQNLSDFSKTKRNCKACLVALSDSGDRVAVQIKKDDQSQILVIDTQAKHLLYKLPGEFNSLYMIGENIVAGNIKQRYDLNRCKKEPIPLSE